MLYFLKILFPDGYGTVSSLGALDDDPYVICSFVRSEFERNAFSFASELRFEYRTVGHIFFFLRHSALFSYRSLRCGRHGFYLSIFERIVLRDRTEQYYLTKKHEINTVGN